MKPATVLIVSEGKGGSPSATQTISFEQPFAYDTGENLPIIHHSVGVRGKAAVKKVLQNERPDAVVLSRYTSALGEYWISQCKTAGVPIIFHIDDDLLEVPLSLGPEKFAAYNAPERLATLRANMENCDLLYTSTPALAERFYEHGIQTKISPGDIYCSVDPNEVGALLPPATGPVIGYMGTGGHSEDLAMVLPAVCNVMERIPDLQFEVFGTIAMPGELDRFGHRVRHLPPVASYADFIPNLRSLGWWIGLAPLCDNPFNRCKADTKWVEYSLSGFAVVASDLPVYQRACADGTGILANDHQSWERALLKLLYDPIARNQMVTAAQDKLRSNYSHEALRAQVLRILSQAGLRS